MDYPTIKITELKEHPNNPRTHTTEQIEKIAHSISGNGWGRPIILSKDNYILAGHGAVMAAETLNLKEVPFKYLEPPCKHDDSRAIAYMVADNKLTDDSDWNYGKLETNFETLKVEGFDTKLTGFEDVELKYIESRMNSDEVREPKEIIDDNYEIDDELEATVKLGEIWQLGNHRLMCGDSTKIIDVKKLMDNNTAEILFTSPPYMNVRDYNKNKDLSVNKLSKFIETYYDYTNYQVVNLGLLFKDGEVIQYWDEYIKSAKRAGYKLLAWNVWDRTMAGTIAQATNMFHLIHEWLFVFGNNKKRLNRTVPNNLEAYDKRYKEAITKGATKGVRQKDGSILMTTSKTYTHHQLHSILQQFYELTPNRHNHPAIFPLGLPFKYIEAMTNEDDIVIDSFGGSGTTLIACEQLQRKCFMMELDPHYCDVIIKRWEDFTNKKAELIKSDTDEGIATTS